MTLISVDKEQRIIKLSGIESLTIDTVGEWAEQMQAAIDDIRQHSPYYDILAVVTHVISKDVAQVLQKLVPQFNSTGVRRIAVVQNSAIAKMQARRITDERNPLVFFSSTEEAYAWLSQA